MFGQIELENFIGLTKMPQAAASAWEGAFEGLVGASYIPLVYLGNQTVNGELYYFIAGQTLTTYPTVRRVVKLAILEKDGEYRLVGDSIEVIA